MKTEKEKQLNEEIDDILERWYLSKDEENVKILNSFKPIDES